MSLLSAISGPSLPHSGAILELDPVPSPLRRRENHRFTASKRARFYVYIKVRQRLAASPQPLAGIITHSCNYYHNNVKH